MEVRLIVLVRMVVSEPVPTVVTTALSLVTTGTFADICEPPFPTLPEASGISLPTLPEASGTLLPTLPDGSGTPFPTFPDASGVSLPTLPGASGVLLPTLPGTSGAIGFDDSVAPLPRGAVPLGPWLMLPDCAPVGYGGPRGPVPRGTEFDGNSTAVETVLSREEVERRVMALGAVLRGTEPEGSGLAYDPVPEGAELRGIGTDEPDVLGRGATEVTLLFSKSFPSDS